MAVLSAGQLVDVRQRLAADSPTLSWSKLQVNAGLQALETWWELTGRGLMGTEIETAAPLAFTVAEKRRLIKHWLRLKIELGG